MATWYEARVCAANPEGRNVLGTRPTMAACALGQLCASTLFEQGVQACADAHTGQVTQALDDVVEANTLLSGVGFESGGLAGAHGYAQGYTNVGHVEENFLHGEMVAMGVIAQLMMEKDPEARIDTAAEVVARLEPWCAEAAPIPTHQLTKSRWATPPLPTGNDDMQETDPAYSDLEDLDACDLHGRYVSRFNRRGRARLSYSPRTSR